EELLPVVAGANPCYLTAPLPQDKAGRITDAAAGMILELAEPYDVLALGPGIGRSESLTKLVITLLTEIQKPVVLDADGLNALEHSVDRLPERNGALIMTPHPGEFGRLLRISAKEIEDAREEHAVSFAKKHQLVLVLKGHGSIVTDGAKIYINSTG